MIKSVKVLGLDELERKLGYPVLVAPAMTEARDTIVARLLRPPPKKGRGKRKGLPPGAGVINNTLTPTLKADTGAQISSTLNYPRTVGSAWNRSNENIFNSMAPRVVNAAIKRIEATWEAGQIASLIGF